MTTKTTHGYELHEPNEFHPYPSIYCRDDKNALLDIREYLATNKTPLEVNNSYDTFYGCAWGKWLVEGTKDIATAKVTRYWDAWGDCRPYPSTIVLTPKNA